MILGEGGSTGRTGSRTGRPLAVSLMSGRVRKEEDVKEDVKGEPFLDDDHDWHEEINCYRWWVALWTRRVLESGRREGGGEGGG